jgi:hypothetical protein
MSSNTYSLLWDLQGKRALRWMILSFLNPQCSARVAISGLRDREAVVDGAIGVGAICALWCLSWWVSSRRPQRSWQPRSRGLDSRRTRGSKHGPWNLWESNGTVYCSAVGVRESAPRELRRGQPRGRHTDGAQSRRLTTHSYSGHDRSWRLQLQPNRRGCRVQQGRR